jgi:hypothetical protein
MISSHVRRAVGALLVAMVAANIHGAAVDTPKGSDGTRATATAQRPSTSKSGAGRGVLPDPVLLDGSTAAPEKKTEHGMIGEFELPGDENVRNGKVGGPQNAQQPGGGGNPLGMPPPAGGGGPQLPAGGKAGQQAGGGQPPPPQQNANGPGGEAAGAGDPNAKAEGIQVAQLGGEPSGNQPGGGGEKPPPVAIGDNAMRIQTSANAPGVVGSQQQAPNTQHHEKGTGTGGKGPTGTGGPNKVEKGRTIPAGL